MIMIGINFMSSTDDPYIVRKDFFHFHILQFKYLGVRQLEQQNFTW